MSDWASNFAQQQKNEDLLSKLAKARLSEKEKTPQASGATNVFGATTFNTSFGTGDSKATDDWGTPTVQSTAQADDGWGGGGAGDSSTVQSPDAAESSPEKEKEFNKEELAYINKLIHNKLVDVKSDLEVLQKDPNSPLYSVKTFEALNIKSEILRGVYEMGFNAPSKIQETALPILLDDKKLQNMIAQSQSGTGKTAAFVLTMLSRVDTSQPHTQCLCLSPTYELALQTGKVIEQMGKHMTQLDIGYAIRGGKRVSRGEMVPHHIVIGTPGTVLDWCMKFKVIDLQKIRVFVLDEADVMIATQGHKDQSTRIQRGLDQSNVQMLLFSATYDTEVINFARSIIPNPVVITLRREEESLDNIAQYFLECGDRDSKFEALSNIYGSITIGQSMIFCRTRATAKWLEAQMQKEGHAVALLSGDLTVEDRANMINRFRRGEEKVLITTNVSARGIDVEQVTVVVNFDLPTTPEGAADCETYLHRIGRTGRFGKKGIALNMISDSKSRQIMRDIESHFGRKILKLDYSDMDEVEKIGGEES